MSIRRVAVLLSIATSAAAQDLDAWLGAMRVRVTVGLQRLAQDRVYSLTEQAHWAASDREGTTNAQRTELFFGDSENWRLYHTSPGRMRVDYARSGASAWDLANGVLVTFAVAHGRIPGNQDLNQPVRSRLASLGYCLTGGLHLIAILGLDDTQLQRLSEHAWRLRASGHGEELVFHGSWDGASRRGRVDRIEVAASRVPARLGDRWTLSEWTVCPATGWDVAGKVTGLDVHGRISTVRTLDSVTDLEPGILATLTERPTPGIDIPLVGRAEVREWRNCESGDAQSRAWLDGRWVPIAARAKDDDIGARLIRLSGWILGLLVVTHGLAMRRAMRRAAASGKAIAEPS